MQLSEAPDAADLIINDIVKNLRIKCRQAVQLDDMAILFPLG